MAAALEHRIIEQAKRDFATSPLPFEEELADVAAATCCAPLYPDMKWQIGERNGAWTLHVSWEPDDDDHPRGPRGNYDMGDEF